MVSDDPRVIDLDINKWSEEHYEWEPDEWNGWKDFTSDPVQTVETGLGDCEDYAFVVASWAYNKGYDVTFAMHFQGYVPIPKHMTVKVNGNVYSSGEIHKRKTHEEYLKDSKYDWMIRRKMNSGTSH